jgi:predicted nucleotide-binding protein
MDPLQEIIDLAKEYNNVRTFANLNSSSYIDMYLSWYAESRAFFASYFDQTDPVYNEFASYPTDVNGFSMGSNFVRQYPLFKVLVNKIQKKEMLEPLKTSKTIYKKCFIVHGHESALKYEVARFIENELSIKAIILHEESNRGLTIIEKFEANKEVDFAVALWTYDDEGKNKQDSNLNPRARQNVVFETGFFFGHLGRGKVIVLKAPEIEIPSDYSGIVYISILGNWKHELSKEIKVIYD